MALVPSGNLPLPEQLLSNPFVIIWHNWPQWVETQNERIYVLCNNMKSVVNFYCLILNHFFYFIDVVLWKINLKWWWTSIDKHCTICTVMNNLHVNTPTVLNIHPTNQLTFNYQLMKSLHIKAISFKDINISTMTNVWVTMTYLGIFSALYEWKCVILDYF